MPLKASKPAKNLQSRNKKVRRPQHQPHRKASTSSAPTGNSSKLADSVSRPQGPYSTKSGPDVVTSDKPLLLSEFPRAKEVAKSSHVVFQPSSAYIREGIFTHHGYDMDVIERVKPSFRAPKTFGDKAAKALVTMIRSTFDMLTGYRAAPKGEENDPKHKIPMNTWINRIIFLETVAAVPGLAGAMVRHLQSIRRFKRDLGWWECQIEESANESMHLKAILAFSESFKPHGWFMRTGVVLTQGIMMNAFFMAYIINPQICHRWVGHLEQEAVVTYTHLLHELDQGWHPEAKLAAPDLAIQYWKMAPESNFRDMINVIRADEVVHCSVNHTLAGLDQTIDPNPFVLQYPKNSPLVNPNIHDFNAVLSHPTGWERDEIDVSAAIHPDVAKKMGIVPKEGSAYHDKPLNNGVKH